MELDRLVKIVSLATAAVGIVSGIVTVKEKMFPASPPPAPIVQATEPLRGAVLKGNGEPVADAQVLVEELPGAPQMSTSDGDFFFPKVPGKPGDRVRIKVSKPGYRNRDEFAALPGPIRIHLEVLK
jgi:hypothetical protein